ncbi:M48 family metallopeptidase [Sorangium sp. So ce363]|uniref:M48 family metallopeptidase n=1 Tax=Sorangium sp. So ce363 TaxID=3133304 RepID=UPI003F601632
MTALVVGDLEFQVRRSDRRRTLEITIDRDGQLLLSAPSTTAPAQLERFARAKQFWVYQKLAAKETLPPKALARQFVSGEGFPYLGRTFRLLLVPELDVPVKLEAGRFKMRRADAVDGHAHMVRWYAAHARPWLEARVERYAGRIEVQPGRLVVQDLGYHWGSCGKGGRLYFHWKTILLPPRVVEYVVLHELVHLIEPHHGSAFWQRLARVMPDYEARKAALAEMGRQLP